MEFQGWSIYMFTVSYLGGEARVYMQDPKLFSTHKDTWPKVNLLTFYLYV